MSPSRSGSGSTSLPRRRRQPRYPLVAPLRVKCSSWTSFRDLFTLNIAQTGLFIPTEFSAVVGERAEITLHTPDSGAIGMTVVVRHILPAKGDRPAGLGVEVELVAERDRAHYEALVQQAEQESRATPGPEGDSISEQGHVDMSPASPYPEGQQRGARRPAATDKPVEQPTPSIVALDFGTSRSSVSVVRQREARVLRLPEGGWDIPSVVGFLANGSVVIGGQARDMLSIHPTRAIRSPKRLLGRVFHDREIEPYLASLAMANAAGPADEVVLHVDDRAYTIPQICAPIIYRLRTVASAFLHSDVTEVVLTAPVSFDEPKFMALAEAARLAGLQVAQFIDEPSAAALAHRHDPTFRGLVAVYDFGGGTFDFSVVRVGEGDFEVVTTAGDTWLGGDDFDEVLAAAAANQFWRDHRIELRHNAVQWQRLLFAAEQAKRELSGRAEAVLRLPEAALRATGPVHLDARFTREQFAELCAPIIQRSLDTCSQALEIGDVKIGDLSAVYLSGGTSYIPAIRGALARHFGQAPRAVVPPERAVAIGAALYANMLHAGRIRA